MIQVCTVSDINYLTKGLALYESLIEHSDDIMLHYLCIDDKSYEKLIKINSDKIKPYNINDFISIDPVLNKLMKNDYRYFCWTLASYFTNHLLNSNIGPITYIDSDIYFHKSLNIILDEIGDRDIGFFRHRQFSLNQRYPDGWFNVGVVYFKPSKIGLEMCGWWADAVLNKKYPQYATCGDQKYLEYIYERCGSDVLYIDENIGHGAPWIWQLYEFLDDGKIKWGNQVQDLVFSHFSQFVDNGESYVPSTMHHIYTPLAMYTNNDKLKAIYDDYHNKLQQISKKYED